MEPTSKKAQKDESSSEEEGSSDEDVEAKSKTASGAKKVSPAASKKTPAKKVKSSQIIPRYTGGRRVSCPLAGARVRGSLRIGRFLILLTRFLVPSTALLRATNSSKAFNKNNGRVLRSRAGPRPFCEITKKTASPAVSLRPSLLSLRSPSALKLTYEACIANVLLELQCCQGSDSFLPTH